MKNLKLTDLEAATLSKKDMRQIVGGETVCGCSCYYADKGGSGVHNNANANAAGGLRSESGTSQEIVVRP